MHGNRLVLVMIWLWIASRSLFTWEGTSSSKTKTGPAPFSFPSFFSAPSLRRNSVPSRPYLGIKTWMIINFRNTLHFGCTSTGTSANGVDFYLLLPLTHQNLCCGQTGMLKSESTPNHRVSLPPRMTWSLRRGLTWTAFCLTKRTYPVSSLRWLRKKMCVCRLTEAREAYCAIRWR